MKVKTVPIDEVLQDPANVRIHDTKNLRTIEGSLRRFGQQKPIVIDKDRIIRAGNGTWEAAKAIGWTHIAVVETALDGADATAYAIADNRTSELADWSFPDLSAQIRGLAHDGFGADTGSGRALVDLSARVAIVAVGAVGQRDAHAGIRRRSVRHVGHGGVDRGGRVDARSVRYAARRPATCGERSRD